MEKLLELSSVSKSYSGVTVLKDIHMTLNKGDILGVVGENGAGKSTLINIISGAVLADGGTIECFGRKYTKLIPRQAIDLGIATIYQEIDLIDNLSVSDNVFLGTEIRNRLGFIDDEKQRSITDELLKKLNLTNISGTDMVSGLSTPQKQCIQIVKALRRDARILILDEPTASLGEQEKKMLLELIKNLAASGIGIIFISHFIEEIFQVCNKILILKDGNQVSFENTADTTPEKVIHSMIGRDASSFYHREYFPAGNRVLRVENYSSEIVHNVSFQFHSGMVLGFGGLVGAGRSELIRLIYGADKKISGELYLNDKKITPTSPLDAINKGIYMISEDRKGEGLLLKRTVRENVTISHNEKKEWIDVSQEQTLVNKKIDDFEIKVHDINDDVQNLSGGNQQKIIIARSMMDEGEIYIFDEPTKGVDIGAKQDIYQHIIKLAMDDKFVIMISSDMPELLSISDKICVMREGRLVDIVDARSVNEDILMRKYLGYDNSIGA